MITRVTLAVAIVLIVTTGAYADSLLAGSIWQQQTFSVGNTTNPGMSSLLNLVHGDQNAEMMQFVDVENVHAAPMSSGWVWTVGTPMGDWRNCGDSCTTRANQYQVGDMDQIVTANGDCGVISVNAFLDAAGGQEQTIGASVSPKMQMQTLGVAADQVLMRSDGAGSGEAYNGAEIYQDQDGSNAAGSVFESSYIEADQMGEVDGQAGSTASLVGGLNATTSQAQVVY
jgi:hypothetical protein